MRYARPAGFEKCAWRALGLGVLSAAAGRGRGGCGRELGLFGRSRDRARLPRTGCRLAGLARWRTVGQGARRAE